MEGGKNTVSRFLTVVYSDVHCSGLNLQTYSDLYEGYCFLCCVEWKGGGSVWCEETNFFLSNLYPNMGSAGDCVWVHSVIQKAHSRFTQSKWSVFWWPEWTADSPLLASGFFFCFWKVHFLVKKFGVNFCLLVYGKVCFLSCGITQESFCNATLFPEFCHLFFVLKAKSHIKFICYVSFLSLFKKENPK